MPTDKTGSPPAAGPDASAPPETGRKHRKRGYRGYPNKKPGGDVHMGTGFAGAGATSPGTSGDSGVVSERTRDDVVAGDEDES